MRLHRPKLRTPPETIIALIDVVFFLLVFFLLIGRLDATAPFRVAPPVAVTGADLPGGGATVALDARGNLALDGRGLGRAALLDALGARVAEDPGLRVRLNADGALELRHVLPLVTELSEAGVRDVVLIVTPEER